MKSLHYVIGVTLVSFLGLTAVSPASATPTPNEGPSSGGTQVTLPTPPSSIAFTSIAAGAAQSFGFGDNGIVYAWGNNETGQLGNGTTSNALSPTPMEVPAGISFTQIAAGYLHSLALDSNGELYAWGNNSSGELGNGSTDQSVVPTRVETPSGVTFTQAAAGLFTSLALSTDGTIYAWGANDSGQLGNGTTDSSLVPTPIAAPNGVTFTSLASGFSHSLALGNDGILYAWGSNIYGQLGDETTVNALVPVPVKAPAGVSFVKLQASNFSSLAMGNDGTLYGWGNNSSGQLGNGSSIPSSHVPSAVDTPAGVAFTDFSIGGTQSLALADNGTFYAWGDNSRGQLGNNSNTPSLVPIPIDLPTGMDFTQIKAGLVHSLALSPNGAIYSWGFNIFGQLGNGTTSDSSVPTPVDAPTGVLAVNRVLFGDTPGTNIAGTENPSFTVVTPQSDLCSVDVTVEWTLNGSPQEPITYPAGFSYVGVAALSTPANQTVNAGQQATFTSTVTGCHQATSLQWEVSADGSAWQSVVLDESTTVSADGTVLTLVNPGAALSGSRYRLAATNAAGTSTSDAATLTVNAPAPRTPGTDGSGGNAQPLAQTGAASAELAILGALALGVAGAWLLGSRIRARHASRV